jgi:hypothetical protein
MFNWMRLSCFFLMLVPGQGAWASQAPAPATEWIPQDAVICVELNRPQALLDLLTGEKMTSAVTGRAIYKKQAMNPKFMEMVNVIRFIEISLDTNWRKALAQLTGGGITLAVCPQDTVVAIIEAKDEQMLIRAHELFLTMARSDAQDKGQPDRIASAEYLGVKGWTTNGQEAHAIIGKRLLIANRAQGLKTMLELRSAKQEGILASQSMYKAALKATGPKAVGRVFVNMTPIKGIPDLAKLLSQDESNPLGALFFAGIIEALRGSTWLALGMDVEVDGLVLRAHVDGQEIDPAGSAAFALPSQAGQGAMPNLRVPRRIAALSFYRDLYRFYAAKDDLFPERTSQLIFFENMMGIFFSGRDLTEEVLKETKPEIRFVIAEQDYDPEAGIPQTQLPAFAAVLRLRNPEAFSEVVEEAWQKAVGLVNFTRGQQAMPGLIIDRPLHEGTKLTLAYFSRAGIEETKNLHSRFNFRPSLALPQDYLILSSTDQLARDLITAVSQESRASTGPLAGAHSLARLDGAPLAAILKTNYQTLVRQNMVNDGKTAAEAEATIDIFIALAQFVKYVDLSIGMEQGHTQARLALQLNVN